MSLYSNICALKKFTRILDTLLLIEFFFMIFVYVEKNLIFVHKLFNYCYRKTKPGQKNDFAM